MNLLPEATKGHLMAARKEILIALRDILDAAVEKAPEKKEPAKRKRKIEVK
jgi:hypothetical protein